MIHKGAGIKESVARQVDVVVVGAGAGGAVAAAILAERGLSVILVDEGPYLTSEDFPDSPLDAARRLYRHGGFFPIHGKAPILLAEGSVVGGSTLVNSAACWRTPSRVLRSWRYELGLSDFTEQEMAPHFEAVEKAIGLGDAGEQTSGVHNSLLLDGARKLGYRGGWTARNAVNCQGAGHCSYGCPHNAKQDTSVSFVPRAIRAGADVYSDCRIDQVIVLNGKVGGVEGRFLNADRSTRGPNVRLHSKAVVVACGSLGSTALLMRSDIEDKYDQTGQHFLCQPMVRVFGVFPDPINADEGALAGAYVDEFAGEGILVLSGMLPPDLVEISPRSSAAKESYFRKNPNHLQLTSMMLDKEEGRIKLLREEPYAVYNLDKNDVLGAKRAVALMAELLFAAGAEKVLTPFAKAPVIENIEQIEHLFQNDFKSSKVEWLSLTPLGGLRIGSERKNGVVNSDGRHYDYPNLYVADGSIIPGSLGVPPQITIMALAHRIAQNLEI